MQSKNFKVVLIVLLALGVVLRILLIPIARHGDLNNNSSWGEAVLDQGPHNLYEQKFWQYSAPNQPPLYLYTFAVTTSVQRLLENAIITANRLVPVFPSSLVWWSEQWSELYFLKFPGIAADIGIALLIYVFFKQKKKTALFLTVLWLGNPIVWYNSAIWGGTDSVVNLLGLLSLFFLLKRKNLMLCLLFFTLSVLFKGSLMLLAPAILYIALTKQFTLKEWIMGGLVSLAVLIIVTLPFHFNADVLIYLFKLYSERFFPGEIGSLTANAFNFWWLIDPGKTLDSTIYIGLPARVWGIAITLTLCAISVLTIGRKGRESRILLAFSLIPFIAFLFMTRIHERYLYPLFPLLTLALGYFKWIWVPYVLISLFHLFNLYHLFWAPGINFVKAWYTSPIFMILLSLVNLLIFFYIFTKYLISHGRNGEK